MLCHHSFSRSWSVEMEDGAMANSLADLVDFFFLVLFLYLALHSK